MTDDRFEEFLKQEAQEYNVPPPTPRDEMWANIQAARRGVKQVRSGRPPWLHVSVGVAAMLLIGVGIGRWTAPESGVVVETNVTAAFDTETDARVYRVAAIDHLSQLDTFISLFRSDAKEGRSDPGTGQWARELLVTTRLMLDSPAGEDAAMRQLLEDLELVLAQISEYSEMQDQTELELIEEDLEGQDLLLRLRAELAINDPTLPTRGEI